MATDDNRDLQDTVRFAKDAAKTSVGCLASAYLSVFGGILFLMFIFFVVAAVLTRSTKPPTAEQWAKAEQQAVADSQVKGDAMAIVGRYEYDPRVDPKALAGWWRDQKKVQQSYRRQMIQAPPTRLPTEICPMAIDLRPNGTASFYLLELNGDWREDTESCTWELNAAFKNAGRVVTVTTASFAMNLLYADQGGKRTLTFGGQGGLFHVPANAPIYVETAKPEPFSSPKFAYLHDPEEGKPIKGKLSAEPAKADPAPMDSAP